MYNALLDEEVVFVDIDFDNGSVVRNYGTTGEPDRIGR